MYVDQARDDAIRRGLVEQKLDALVCRLADNIVFLSGYYPNIGNSMVIYPVEGEPTIVAPFFEDEFYERGRVDDVRTFETWQLRWPDAFTGMSQMVKQVCREKGLAGKRIGYEGSFEAIGPNIHIAEPACPTGPTKKLLQEAAPNAILVDATDLLHELRAIKTPVEIERIRLANEVCCLGLNALRETAQPGRSEAEIATAIEGAVMAKGMDYPGVRFARAICQVSSGPRTEGAWAYPITSNRRIQAGEMVQCEIAAVADGYWCDLTRAVVAGGKASARQKEVFAAVIAAQQAAAAELKVGVVGTVPHAAAYKALADAGIAETFRHHTGHGCGFRYHEPFPKIRPDSTDVLAVGHVVSIEPGVYIPGFGACRREETYAIGESGAKALSHSDWGIE